MTQTDPAADARRDLSALQFRVEPFAPEHLPLVETFSERYWTRPRTAAYYRWRYLESQPFSRMALALTDDECLGMIFGFRKTYLLGGQITPCLEIFDWHSLPGLSGSGIGIRVMRALMRENVRLFGIGGTPDAVKALPAMGWQNIDSARAYELPVSGESLVEGLRRRIPQRLPGERLVLNAVAAWFRPRRRGRAGQTIPVGMLGDEVDRLYATDTGYDLVQVPDRQWLRWLTAASSGTGGFRFWYFSVGGRLRGWAVTRVYEAEQGREAAIVDIFAPNPEPELYEWMVSEAAASLVGERPRLIRARATCPVLQTALRANKFRAADAVPVFTFPKLASEPRRLHITLNHTDACLRPYPVSGIPGQPVEV